MKHGALLFCGVLTAFSASWWGMVAYPQRQLSVLSTYVGTNDAGVAYQYPTARSGDSDQGRQVYVSLGCVECHTQQVRPADGGGDISKGWGRRRTVARDYLYDDTVQLGNSRIGPDLANYGERLGTNAFPIIRQFNPQLVVSNTICPPLPFLFDRRMIRSSGPSADALVLKGAASHTVGQEVVPTLAAYQLAAYLKSLHTSVELPEAGLPASSEEASK